MRATLRLRASTAFARDANSIHCSLFVFREVLSGPAETYAQFLPDSAQHRLRLLDEIRTAEILLDGLLSGDAFERRGAIMNLSAKRNKIILKRARSADDAVALSSMCSSCHAMNANGGDLGPDLSRVARSKDRDQLLSSILKPLEKMTP